ncbi:MAG: hypothetical protein AAF639_44295 [Chloroflexota bacterium]
MSNEKRDKCEKKQKVMKEIEELQGEEIIVVNAEELERLEKEIQGLMDRLVPAYWSRRFKSRWSLNRCRKKRQV